MYKVKNICLWILLLCIPLVSCTPHFRWNAMHDELNEIKIKHNTQNVSSIPYQDFAGTIHVHTHISHDSKGKMEDIITATKKAGSQFVITTDHYTSKVYREGVEGMHNGILVIRGTEMVQGCPKVNGIACNSFLVFGLPHDLYFKKLTNMREVIEMVKQNGGLIFAAHPTIGFTDWELDITGMEIYDIFDDVRDKKWKFPQYFFDVLYSFDYYPDEVFLSILDHPNDALNLWDNVTSKGRKIVSIAGNDAHQNVRFFDTQLDSYNLILRFVRTHIFAHALDEKNILQGLKYGHSYISFDILANATGFEFYIQNRMQPQHIYIMGDDLSFTPNLILNIQIPLDTIPDISIRVIKNGIIYKTFSQPFATFPLTQKGIYRVEVSLKVQGAWLPWIYSNPIYVR